MMDSVKRKTYVNILVFASIIFAMFYFGFIYLVEEEENLSLEIISKKKEARQLKSQNEQIKEIRSVHQEWQEKTETVLKTVTRSSELFEYVIEIKDLAVENDIELETILSAKDKGKIDNDFSYTYYKIKATGHFSNVMKFLASVENLKYYSEMENIFYDSVDEDSEEILFTADLKIYLYRNQDEKN
ncbi:MAG: type 4a pilus biogenesis protein PilO [Patescibacteria group bacterium]|nr:type 4a pilus biogenesis protein PilO [Patescibacteria group bacterium]